MVFTTLFEKVISDLTEMFSIFVTQRAAGAKKIENAAREKVSTLYLQLTTLLVK